MKFSYQIVQRILWFHDQKCRTPSHKTTRSFKYMHRKEMGPMSLLLILCGCFLAEGIPSTEEKQTSEILTRLEAKLEKQEAKLEKQEAKIENQEAKIKNQEAKVQNQEARIKNQEAKIAGQEAKIEKQDAAINELHGKNEALRRDMSDQLKRIETKANRTEEALETIGDTELLSSTGGKAVRDLPYIMMCAYRGAWHDTGIIPYENLTLDYSNCDRPGETL